MYKKFSNLIEEKEIVRKVNFFDNQKIKEIKLENKTVKKYEDLYRKPVNNNSLILVEVLSIKSIMFEFSNYTDNYPFLFVRKNFILLTRFLLLKFEYLSLKICISIFISLFFH